MKLAQKQALLSTLEQLYPNPRSELVFEGEYQLLVSVILSAQCTDKKVNQVTPELFKQFPDFKSLSRSDLEDLKRIIRPINYYKTKAKNLRAMAQQVVSAYGDKLPQTHHDLITLPGVGNKTANVVLSELGLSQTFPVDTHVFRLSNRLGLVKAKTVEQAEEQLKREFDASNWRKLHHWLIFHGRRVCKASSPQCQQCSLAPMCPSVHAPVSPKLRKKKSSR